MDELVDLKAQQIKLLALDIDGVMTDGGLNIGDRGEIFKRFNAHDGLGISAASRNGMKIVFITGRVGGVVLQRASELGIAKVCSGVVDKRKALIDVAAEFGVPLTEVAFMGDDLNDLPALSVAGLTLAPANASEDVKAVVDYVTAKSGGNGAVREVIELILRSEHKWDKIVAAYLQAGQGDQQ
ncbi:MAG: HAD hydrolase family protein [Acidaminococcaceae bacterium]|jgi:3-deoxy-D-manno-octulosonate 8-phosphate phosphatase (KDO 8-P phosphatase)|nr:HAD hydrolase family protein [Acidaminococcaceae bacterium]